MCGAEPEPELLVVQARKLKADGDQCLDDPERSEEEGYFEHDVPVGECSQGRVAV